MVTQIWVNIASGDDGARQHQAIAWISGVLKQNHMVVAYFHDTSRGAQHGNHDPEGGVVSMLGRRVKYHGKYATTNVVLFLSLVYIHKYINLRI